MSDRTRISHAGTAGDVFRRRFMGRGAAIAGTCLAPGLLWPDAAAAADATEWGWPQPYTQVSPQSVE